MAKIRVTTPATRSNVQRPVGTYLSAADSDPAPPCQWPECPRRSMMAYRDAKTGRRVFRPWCRAHRGGVHAVSTRPRPYRRDPETWQWPPEVKCPFCENKREPRQKGVYRSTCRRHRGKVITPPKTVKVFKVKKIKRPRPSPPPKPNLRVPVNPLSISFKDGSRVMQLEMTLSDSSRLRALFNSDAGHYAAATDKKLSRKYPTAAIAALWSRWAQMDKP